jgi:hypothetical protein
MFTINNFSVQFIFLKLHFIVEDNQFSNLIISYYYIHITIYYFYYIILDFTI